MPPPHRSGTRVYFEKTPIPVASPGLPVHDRAYIHTQAVVGRLLNGQKLVHLPAHVPQLYDKNILARLEGLLAAEFRETSLHRFRAEDDLVMRIMYFAYLLFSDEQKGKGHEARFLKFGRGRYHFILLNRRLRRLWQVFCITLLCRPKFFCVNDDLVDELFDSRIVKIFALFLKLYFPRRGTFEKN